MLHPKMFPNTHTAIPATTARKDNLPGLPRHLTSLPPPVLSLQIRLDHFTHILWHGCLCGSEGEDSIWLGLLIICFRSDSEFQVDVSRQLNTRIGDSE